MLYFTYVVRPGEAPEGRGPHLEPFWNFLIAFNLRIGLFLQCLAYIGLMTCLFMGGKTPLALLGFMRADPNLVSSSPVTLAQICCGLLVMGNLMCMSFQSLTDDDGSIKQSRGYRSGTKFLQHAASIGLFGSTLTLVSFWAANNYFDDLWLNKHIGAGSNWLIFFTGRLCDAFSLILYGLAVFFLESYHSEGVGECWGWIISTAFTSAAVIEVLGLATIGTEMFGIIDNAYSCALLFAWLCCLIWAIAFEPISHRYDVKLTQSAMRNEYYKSRNAMAYYGPAVVNADGEIDIGAAAEQAQAAFNN